MKKLNNKVIKLNKYGTKPIIKKYFTCILLTLIFFLSAGRLDILRAWIFFIIFYSFETIEAIILYKKFPEFLNIRGEKKQGTKTFDKIIRPLYNIIVFYVFTLVAGLDLGRYNWSSIDFNFIFLGIALVTIANCLLIWAILHNIFFESTVRIQTNRNQKVIMSGPYKYIRHPGYAGLFLSHRGYPLIIGSIYSYIPIFFGFSLLIIRTYLEDKTLRKELKGYGEYSKKVKYRLFPRIW